LGVNKVYTQTVSEKVNNDVRVEMGLPPLIGKWWGHAFVDVHESSRRQGVAVKLFDKMLETMSPGDVFSSSDYSDMGLPFVISWAKSRSGKIHIIEDDYRLSDYDPTMVNFSFRLKPSLFKSARRVARRYLYCSKRTFYHGTSAKNLRRILKVGLVPAGTEGAQRVYDEPEVGKNEIRSIRTFGGVYLTTSLSDADDYARKSVGEFEAFAIVKVQLEDHTPGVLLDEDVLEAEILDLTSIRGAFDLFRSHRSDWARIVAPFLGSNKTREFIPLKNYPAVVQAILTHKDNFLAQRLVARISQISPRMFKSFRHLGAEVLHAADMAVKRYVIHLLDSSFARNQPRSKKPEVLQDSFRLMQEAFDKFLSYGRATGEDTKSQYQRIRFPGPITYRGSTRILSVVSVTPEENLEKEYFENVPREVYGSAPEIVAYYNRYR
jgi:hypothetical protein